MQCKIEGVEWRRTDEATFRRRPQCARALALTTNGTGSVEGVGSWGALELHGGMQSGDGLRRAWGGTTRDDRTLPVVQSAPRHAITRTLLVVSLRIRTFRFLFFLFTLSLVTREFFEWLPRASYTRRFFLLSRLLFSLST